MKILFRSCKDCFGRYVYCDEDHEDIISYYPDLQAQKEILNLKCYCLFKNDGCAWEDFSHELEDHLKICQFVETETSECPYKTLNCNEMGSRKHILNHREKDMIYHHALLSELLKSECMNLNLVAKVISELKNFESIVLSEFNNDYINKVKNLKSRIDSIIKRKLVSKSFFKYASEVNALEQQIKLLTSYFDIPSITTKLSFEEHRIERAAKENEMHMTRLSDIRLKLSLLHSLTNDGIFLWRIEQFPKKLEQALAGRNVELLSPPLMTDASGYKFCIILMLAGDPKFNKHEQKSFISIYISILPSDFDEVLAYPFPYSIDISLLNVSKGKDLTLTLKPDQHKAFEKPYQEMNPPVGFSKFCSHDQLYSGGYIKDDSLFIKLNVLK